jgi:hypothetical protein
MLFDAGDQVGIHLVSLAGDAKGPVALEPTRTSRHLRYL